MGKTKLNAGTKKEELRRSHGASYGRKMGSADHHNVPSLRCSDAGEGGWEMQSSQKTGSFLKQQMAVIQYTLKFHLSACQWLSPSCIPDNDISVLLIT